MVKRAANPLRKTRLALFAAVALLFAACTALVTPDRRKVKDDLYRPTPMGDASGGTGGAGGTGDEDAGQDAADDAAGNDAATGDGAAADGAAGDGSLLDVSVDLTGGG